MFHNCHKLDGIITEAFDARQDIFGKIDVGADPRLLRGDSHVGLVHAQSLNIVEEMEKIE